MAGTLVDTGDNAGTGGRLKKVADYLAPGGCLLHDLRGRRKQTWMFQPPVRSTEAMADK